MRQGAGGSRRTVRRMSWNQFSFGKDVCKVVKIARQVRNYTRNSTRFMEEEVNIAQIWRERFSEAFKGCVLLGARTSEQDGGCSG